MEDLEYLEEEEDLMVAAAVLEALEAVVDLTVAVLVAALTVMMDSEGVAVAAEEDVVVTSTGTANNNGRVRKNY